jgi:hypothetical protein
VKKASSMLIAGLAGLALAFGTAVPANAVTILWPSYTQCSGNKKIQTKSTAKYTVRHLIETGGGQSIMNFSNGPGLTVNTWNTGLRIDLQGNASGVYLSSASLACK